ncbi:hypothetical protein MOQ_000448 [Trypanosoma cruzi marinkellei]|uniref:Core Histone H2A/H2B/H3 domain-containing protein n=1 Tax=Trypanosoma cruzi marinkellei TaxID=85056 RepID=K2PED0_TRYCR|nr:hypothetical protein MOQ_000448 [Trypanosoma cruzi marinkellei]
MQEEHTFDDPEAAFFTPRLSIATGDTQIYAAPLENHSRENEAQHDELKTFLVEANELEDEEKAYASLFHEGINDEEEATYKEQVGQQALNGMGSEEATFDAGIFFLGKDDNDTGDFDSDRNEAINEANGGGAFESEEFQHDDADSGDEDDDNVTSERSNRPNFPLSRVRELLKFHSSSTIVAKDAALVAGEAVALMLQDLTRLAVAEAERQRRRTVTYVDVARVVHHFDRFSFLSDIIPPVPVVASGPKAVAVGSATSLATESKTIRNAAREGTVRTQLKSTGTGGGGASMRQTTLRF